MNVGPGRSGPGFSPFLSCDGAGAVDTSLEPEGVPETRYENLAMQTRRVVRLAIGFAVGVLFLSDAEEARALEWLRPREIEVNRVNVAPELVAATRDSPVERGRRRPLLDGVGWVVGIPSKIILWDRRVENHLVSARTEESIRRYLDDNDLDHVKVRINQYAPVDDWRRLRANKTVGWGYRYTLGALSVAGEAILPGRLIGGDHYNPFTATIHLYSDVPAIALHEGGHAKDFTRRRLPGTYALVTALPFGSLWPEAIATGDAIAYAENRDDAHLERESYRILFPAYGTYLGGSLGDFTAPLALPIYAGAVVAGHAVGRVQARLVPDTDGDGVFGESDHVPAAGVQAAYHESAEPDRGDDGASARLPRCRSDR